MHLERSPGHARTAGPAPSSGVRRSAAPGVTAMVFPAPRAVLRSHWFPIAPRRVR